MFSEGLLISKRPFQDGQGWKKLLFSGHISKKFQRPTIPQLSIEGFTASKMNFLHYLALQSKALVILLQETHSIDAEKLVLPSYQLARYSLSRKHGLATFVHERLRYTLLDQSLPTSEIEWLCVDVDSYKIVNVYKPPPTQLQSPISQYFCNAKDAASFYSARFNTGTNPNLAFASVDPNSRLPDWRVLEKLSRSQHLCLLHHQGFPCHCQACLFSNGTSARPNGVITLL